MRFTIPLMFVAGVMAQTDIASIFENIQSLTEDATAAVEAYEGGDAQAIDQAASEAVAAVTAATESVEGLDTLAQAEAIGLVTPIQDLTAATQGYIDALVAKQSVFEEEGIAADIFDSLTSQSEASAAFSDALVSKLPEALQDIGRQSAEPIAAAYAEGLAAFEGADAPAPTEAATTATETATETPYETEAASTPYASPTDYYPTPYNTSTPAGPTYVPEPYDGGAAKTAAGLGAMAMAALVAAF